MSVHISNWSFLYSDALLEGVFAAFILNLTCRIVELRLNHRKVELNWKWMHQVYLCTMPMKNCAHIADSRGGRTYANEGVCSHSGQQRRVDVCQ